MRILLAIPSHKNIRHLYLPRFITQGKGSYPPLGLLYIASMLKKNGFIDVQVFDGQLYRNPERAFEQKLSEFKPDILGISALTPTLHRSYKLAQIAKKHSSKTLVVLGGAHCSLYPEEVLSLKFVDAVVTGEGEEAFLKIVRAKDSGDKPDNINGALMKSDGDITGLRQPEIIYDLDALPFPDRTLVPRDKYFIVVDKPLLATSMLTSRGCPYRCAFCDPTRKTLSTRSAGNVVDEFESCQDMGFKIVNLVDDTFNIKKSMVLDICREITRRNLKISWSFQGRVTPFDREMAEALQEAGCRRIQFGIEAGTDRVLRLMRKGFNVEQAENALRISKEYRFVTVAFFILGYPGETRDEIIETINFSLRANPDYAQFLPLSLQPGTKLYNDYLRDSRGKDFFKDYTIDESIEYQEIYLDASLTRREINSMLRYAFRRFYFRKKYILEALKSITSPVEFYRKLKVFISMLGYELNL